VRLLVRHSSLFRRPLSFPVIMGICASCLGMRQGSDLSEEDENSRLLFDDAHANHYGSFGDQNTGIVQADPQEVQRENEALQKVVAQTSNHLVDIFAMVPQSVAPVSTAAFPAQDARSLRYQHVLRNMSIKERQYGTNQAPIESIPNASDGWISEEEDVEESKGSRAVESSSVGPLLGGFADAEFVE